MTEEYSIRQPLVYVERKFDLSKPGNAPENAPIEEALPEPESAPVDRNG